MSTPWGHGLDILACVPQEVFFPDIKFLPVLFASITGSLLFFLGYAFQRDDPSLFHHVISSHPFKCHVVPVPPEALMNFFSPMQEFTQMSYGARFEYSCMRNVAAKFLHFSSSSWPSVSYSLTLFPLIFGFILISQKYLSLSSCHLV